MLDLFLTWSLEREVRRVHLERLRVKKEGRLFVGEDVRVDVWSEDLEQGITGGNYGFLVRE